MAVIANNNINFMLLFYGKNLNRHLYFISSIFCLPDFQPKFIVGWNQHCSEGHWILVTILDLSVRA